MRQGAGIETQREVSSDIDMEMSSSSMEWEHRKRVLGVLHGSG